MSGWCFAENIGLTEVRIVVEGLNLGGTYRIARPDVLNAFPGAPDELTGFSVKGYLPSGVDKIHLEFKDSNGTWHRALSLPVLQQRHTFLRTRRTGDAGERLLERFPVHATHPAKPLDKERFLPGRTNAGTQKIVIAVPSFQHGKHLSQTLESLSSACVACFVKDGASTDDSRSILRRYESDSIRWTSSPDAGQSAAIQTAFLQLPKSPDDVMAWINSDDYYLPHALDYVSSYFAKNPETDVIYGHRILVDEESREIGRWFLPRHDEEVLRLQDFVPQETMFWRRRIWDKVGGIDPSFKFAMDWDLLLRFQAAGAKIVRVPYFLACFRIHAAQKTSAQMESVGQKEIDALRLRTFGRALSPAEIENNPRLIRYLRKSAWIEFLWRRFGIRHP